MKNIFKNKKALGAITVKYLGVFAYALGMLIAITASDASFSMAAGIFLTVVGLIAIIDAQLAISKYK